MENSSDEMSSTSITGHALLSYLWNNGLQAISSPSANIRN